jgi:hypothetical protein
MPDPKNYDSKDEFVKACVPIVIKEGTAKDGAQATAICNSMWENKDTKESKMKLETVNLKDIEIFETGVWQGFRYENKDLDEMVKNFNDGVAEPYLTIDHSPKAAKQFRDALKALSLGFVDNLKRVGNKLVAGFKQVPKTIAELIEAGALKKKSVEFHKFINVNGILYKNVLEGVTFHGANGLPEVNTLSEYLELYKSHLTVMKLSEDVVSLKNEDKEETMSDEKKVDELTSEIENLKKDKIALEKKNAELETLKNKGSQDELEKFKTENDSLKGDVETMTTEKVDLEKKVKDLEKFKADTQKSQEDALAKEADEYVTAKIQDQMIRPDSKDMYVKNYLMYKKESEEAFKVFKDDIENRKKILNLGEEKDVNGNPIQGKYKMEQEYVPGKDDLDEDAEKQIQTLMKAKNIDWNTAAIELGITTKTELGIEEA